MNLDQKLRALKKSSAARDVDRELERTLEILRRMDKPPEPRKLPAQRVTKGIEEYVEGVIQQNHLGEYFVARQAFPFGRPYGKLRISDISAADLSPLKLFFPQAALPNPERFIYLDTETTGLAGGTGTCAFLIGIGTLEGSQFVVRQFFLRDYPEEKAILHALAEILDAFEGIITYNGKTFDIPLLETRYALARLKSPFTRLLHFDALHPARRLWRLRLESCKLQDLESAILGIEREGDIPGSDIPAIYFDYLRAGDARGLQPVFHHNALDIMTLAAVTVELARAIGDGGNLNSPVDLFSLSRMFEVAGSRERSVTTCQLALTAGLPQEIEARALHQLAMQFKRQRQHELAVEKWLELSRTASELAIEAFEELAIHYEHHRRDHKGAMEYTLAAIELLGSNRGISQGFTEPSPATDRHSVRFSRRLERLKRKVARAESSATLPIG